MKAYMMFICFALHIYAAPLKVLVSVPPQKEIIESIGGEFVEVRVLVPPSKSPEIYEPSVAQMKHIADSVIFFGVGMPFESVWFKRFKQSSPALLYYNLAEHTHEHSAHSHDKHNHAHNPHIWLSPKGMQEQVTLIANALSEQDSAHADIFKARALRLNQQLQNIVERTTRLFSLPQAQKTFLVYHPAFEGFARDFNVQELSLEIDGKEAKGRALSALLDEVKAKQIKVVFIQPQFAKARVEGFAKEAGLAIIELNPLREDWLLSLQENACQIAFSLPLSAISACMQTYFKE